MKPKTFTFSRSRKILSLLCVGGLAIIGFAEAFRQYSLSKLQNEPVYLPVPILKQSRGSDRHDLQLCLSCYAHQ